MQPDNGEVQPGVRSQDLSVALGGRCNRQPGRSCRKRIDKFTSSKHIPSQDNDGTTRLKVLNRFTTRRRRKEPSSCRPNSLDWTLPVSPLHASEFRDSRPL